MPVSPPPGEVAVGDLEVKQQACIFSFGGVDDDHHVGHSGSHLYFHPARPCPMAAEFLGQAGG